MTETVDGPSEELVVSVHAELRRIAQGQMGGERGDHTLQATALVHEAWLALRDRVAEARSDPRRFYLAASESMRRILIDHARRRNAQKRGGGRDKIPLDLVQVAESAALDDVLALDEAIQTLAARYPRAADVVRLRFFAGLDEAATAHTLGLSDRTVRREWAFARAFLFRCLTA
ncbi:MAG: sigma-70 family RNA polymerase sigma factor [Planctomycetes bacterium]|nr:sigma-70 family RNA polymerase sigma factor [Planctomycetota bacterium]